MRKLLIVLCSMLLFTSICFAENKNQVEVSIEIESNTPTTIIIENNMTKEEIDIDNTYTYTLSFSEIGRYVYKVYQKDNIDKTIYEINVLIYMENEQLVGIVFGEDLEDKLVKVDKISFNNILPTEPPTTVIEETTTIPETTTVEPTTTVEETLPIETTVVEETTMLTTTAETTTTVEETLPIETTTIEETTVETLPSVTTTIVFETEIEETTELQTEPIYTTTQPNNPPDTGDHSNLLLYGILGGVSIIGVGILLITSKRKESKK